MQEKRIVLRFPKKLVDKPLVFRLAKDFDLEFNILKAEVNPNEEGLLVLELRGKDADYRKGLNYLKEAGVEVQPLSKDVSMDESRCVDCTVCVPLCPTGALVKDDRTFKVSFLKDKCIACGICIRACPFGAMKIEF